jgi:predicted alpha-1,2-mannosidase
LKIITRSSLLLASTLCFSAFASSASKISYIDPFIGTGGDGHTFPGAVVPFGMVQLSPDTDNPMRGVSPQPEIYKRCAGYHYDDTTIVGFSHTHFSGTGHSDLGDLLIMPQTGEVTLEPGTQADPDSGYRSRFSHSNETASPGYYQVYLKDYKINAELSATERAGIHQYTFEQNQGHVLLDLTHSIYNFSNKVIWSDVRVINDTTLVAYRATNGWANNRQMYFAIEFSKPFSEIELHNLDNQRYRCNGCLDDGKKAKHSTISNTKIKQTAGKAIKVVAHFDNLTSNPLLVKVGVSAVSKENALENLTNEIPHWDFTKVVKSAEQKWAAAVDKFDVNGETSQKRQFYTSLYHALQAPSIYQDVNGQYRGLDGNVHEAKDHQHYTLFSLWDTYRALHPLLTYVAPERVPDMVSSMLDHYQQTPDKMLPIWSFHAHETWTMIGYHAVSVIADAYLKGLTGFDVALAKEAILATANHAKYDAIPEYKKYGYVPSDVLPESVSITLEYAYDDFAIAQFFSALGDKKTADTYYARAMNYKNVWDANVGFVNGRNTKGEFDGDFDPQVAKYMGAFTEGNSFQYSFYVPQDVAGLIALMGGDNAFEARLDALFETHLSHEKIKEHEDIAGLIGQYAHGNEPSHHIAYLYNYAGKPWRTQERIRQIMDTLSSDTPQGLAGNDDVGQMSAWFIFSSMGFYPVAPGDLSYAIGAPQLPFIALTLANGKTFTVKAHNLSSTHKYIRSARLNGKPLERSFITHADIMAGSTLEFEMSETPNTSWATSQKARPASLSNPYNSNKLANQQ